MVTTSFLEYFSQLEYPREAYRVIYPLDEILLVVMCGSMAGADDFVEIQNWAKLHIDFLRRFLPFKCGVCSHDTLNNVINALPHDLFAEHFTLWVQSLQNQQGSTSLSSGDVVAIDGKSSRRAHGKDAKPLHLVSAWASAQRLVLGQEPCSEKENEIRAIPRLLERLEIAGALVTIDAMGCQHGIADDILAQGADYFLAVKGNQKTLHQELCLYFDVAQGLETHSAIDAGHGRIEERAARVCHATGWLTNQAKTADAPKFNALSGLVEVTAKVERNGKTATSRRYFISSATLTAQQALEASRAHWGIENNLHWVMDVVFHDDLMRLRTGDGPQNMALIRHIILNLVKNAKDKASLKTKRKKLGWSTQYMYDVIAK